MALNKIVRFGPVALSATLASTGTTLTFEAEGEIGVF